MWKNQQVRKPLHVQYQARDRRVGLILPEADAMNKRVGDLLAEPIGGQRNPCARYVDNDSIWVLEPKHVVCGPLVGDESQAESAPAFGDQQVS